MGKIKATLQQKKAPTIKNTQSIKKRKKEIGKKGSLRNRYKNDLRKPNRSNELKKDIATSIQNIKKKHNFENKRAKDTKNTSTKYSNNDNKTKKIFQTNTGNKRKGKNKNNRTKQNINQTNNIKTNVSIVKKSKNPEASTKKSRRSELANKKIKNIKKINKKKLKQKNQEANAVIRTNKKPEMKKSIYSELTERKLQNIKKTHEKKLKKVSTKPEVQQVESKKILKFNNHRINVTRLDQMLNKAQTAELKSTFTLKDRMMRVLRASRFRFINETLYNNDSSQSKRYFKEEPDAFKAYHEGYKQQVELWPVNPLDVIISYIKDTVPTGNIIADFGCGEARLASSVPHKVHSFDFIALNDNITACDMAHTPLLANSVHVVVFCLSLMGTNLNDYIMEASRILKTNGVLKIAEVASRFDDVKDFIKLLGSFGFKNTLTDLSHDLFYFMDFKKVTDLNAKRKNLPAITLKACLYKKR